MNAEKAKQKIFNEISDLCSNFLYYDRKEDEDLSVKKLNKAFKKGVVTIDECVEEFRKHLENTLNQEEC